MQDKHKVVVMYTDAGVSGRKPISKRPELQHLLLVSKFGIVQGNHHVKAVLQNERYIGINNGIKVCDTLIPPEEFAFAQRMLTARSVCNMDGKHTWLFSGLVWCADCGERLITHWTTQHSQTYYYYRCKNYPVGLCIHKKRINESALESYLLGALPKEAGAHNARLNAKNKAAR